MMSSMILLRDVSRHPSTAVAYLKTISNLTIRTRCFVCVDFRRVKHAEYTYTDIACVIRNEDVGEDKNMAS